ncbi:TPA: hypothetical protein NKA96_004651 [Vibrio parahaemolyticus]|nr:hypothetical protein [Vibrio parahaemolyticus]HCG7221302.1 hypothetical protein [Vibrio parahaemolyticus]HCG8445626.1 hypothetical protein [Vibrio parahaemolyticus]HCG8618654.1 hypothetical protein [Vibrio parahaemolyticus]
MNTDRKIAIASFVVAVLSLIVAVLAIFSSENIAEKSGAYDKAVLAGYLGKNRLLAGQTSHLVIGVDFNKNSKGYVIGGVPIAVGNLGEKSLKNVDLMFKYHQMFNRNIFESMDYIVEGGYAVKYADRHFSKMGNQELASYRFPSMKPHVFASVVDPLMLEKTTITEFVELADGYPIAVTVEFAMKIDVSISAEDILPINSQVTVSALDVATKEQLESKVFGLIDSDLKQIREDLGFVRYLSKLLFSHNSKQISYVFPDVIESSTPKVTWYHADLKLDDISSISYEAIQWAYLFH